MVFGIIPSDFTLLSDERQAAFEISGNNFKESIDKATQEICFYVRNILPGVELSQLAHTYQLDTGIVIILSNYANTKKQLEGALKNDTFLKRIRHPEGVNEVKDIIKNDIRNFSLDKIGEIEELWNRRQEKIKEKNEQERKLEDQEREQVNNERYTLLCNYFCIEDTEVGRELLCRNGITYGIYAKEIIQYCKENNITTLGTDGWSYKTGPAFLNWYADLYGLERDYSPDEAASYAGVSYLQLWM